MQIFFLVLIGLYGALVLYRFVYNMWVMLTLDKATYALVKLEHYLKTGKTYVVDHNEYASFHIYEYLKYFAIRFVIVSVLVWVVIRFV